jgi:hypothetical protein
MNFRTEILANGVDITQSDIPEFVRQVTSDFDNFRLKMDRVKSRLEPWIEFINPYQRVRRAVAELMRRLEGIRALTDSSVLATLDKFDIRDVSESWGKITSDISEAYGLCFGIRSMLPVMAESFVNLLIYFLARPEIRSDSRLFDQAFRQPIDVRVKRLAIDCVGFDASPDFSNQVCTDYNRLVNERNDLLHGNIAIKKLKFNDVFFLGTVPIFEEYKTPWARTMSVQADAVGYDSVQKDFEVVEDFTEYLLTCLKNETRDTMKLIANKYELGFNSRDNRLGLLFPEALAEIYYHGPRFSS